MNIWLPILMNAIILGILIGGIIVGKKNGFKHEFIKFILLCGSCVGIYFLAPVCTNLLLSTGIQISFTLLNSVVFAALFFIIYLFITLILKLFKRRKENSINNAKRVKIRGIDRKTSRELKREERKFRKLNRVKPQLKTSSKVFGILFGFLTSILIGAALMLPVKYTFNTLFNKYENLTEITTGFEYTAYGQLDNLTDMYDFINQVKGENK